VILSVSRRRAAEITYKILNDVSEKGESTKWDLIKIVGNEQQFNHYITDFILKKECLKERTEGRNYFYSLTQRGRELHSVLKKDYLFKMVVQISGSRLRSEEVL
jgi:predicted transcriptional regulator